MLVLSCSVSVQSQLDSFMGNCTDIGSPSGQQAALGIVPPANLALSKNSSLNITNAVGYTLAVWVEGEVVACSIVETVFAVGVTHRQGNTPAIQQLLPYFSSKLMDESITLYSVLEEAGSSEGEECRNPSAVHNPWVGEGSPVGDLASKRKGMAISAPIIGDATIVGHSVSVHASTVTVLHTLCLVGITLAMGSWL